jgi:hypothetical protein
MGHFMPLVRLLRWFNSQRRTYATGKCVLGGAANGGNGGEADNSATTIAAVVALMTYADVEKVITHYHRCRT